MNKFSARQSLKTMSSRQAQEALVVYWTQRCKQILQERGTLPREELEYVVEQSAKLKDARLVGGITGLIGWGDEERAELETFCALALEVMREASPSKLRDASLRVELRYLSGLAEKS